MSAVATVDRGRQARLSGVAKIVYTDGACSPNPGRGGWAWWVSDHEFGSGAAESSTNNVMELRAVIEALKAQPYDQFVQIVSDSKYVVDCFNQRWHEGWRRRNWKNAKGEPVKNREVWEELLAVVDERTANTKWVYVKGHSGDVGNERADSLAVAARLGHAASSVPDEPDDVLTVRAARALLERAVLAEGPDHVAPDLTYFDSAGQPVCLIGHLLHYLDYTPADAPEGVTVWHGLRDLIPAADGVMEGLDCAQDAQDGGAPWSEALAAFDFGVSMALA